VIFKNIQKRIRLFKTKNKEPYLSLYQILGFYPNNPEIYEQAFVHSSIRSVQEGRRFNNERLEFLGDAILSAVISDIVYKHFPNRREGFLTITRSKIVQRESLNKIGIELGLDKKINSMKYALLHNKYMWGNALEALIGAIYLDKGYRFTFKFIEQIVEKYLEIEKIATQEVNFKSRLLEWGQKNRMLIEFELLSNFIDDEGKQVFQSSVMIEGVSIEVGVGNTKKESQQIAAHTVLRRLKKEKDVNKLMEYIKNEKSSQSRPDSL
jgi:ribonuclease-3